ncbi:MAG: apolipoprotein N-acyltransferase [Streptosporangiaceae bacterium]
MAIPRGLAQPARYAVLLAGGVPALAFPAPNLEFLAWFGLVPGLLLIRAAPSQREALVRGWWFGTGYLLAGLYWLIPNLGPALLLVAIVLGALWMALALALWRLLRPPVTAWRAVGALAVVPSCWLAGEWVRSWEFLGGPWAVFGASQWQHPAILALAAVGGVWLVTVALVAANTGIVIALVASRPAVRLLGAAATAVAIAAGPVAFALTSPAPVTGHLTIALVQPGLTRGGVTGRMATNERLTARRGRGPGLVVWGESSVGLDLRRDAALLDRLRRLSASVGAQLLVNEDALNARGAKSKAAELIGPGGIAGTYVKTRLVPFGEYIPFRAELGWLSEISQAAPQNVVAGAGAHVLHATASNGQRLTIGVLICFESAFPDMSRVDTDQGARVIIYQTSDSTFQGSWALAQHASLSAVRAAETGRPVVQAALTGDSAAFDDRGRLLAWDGAGQRGVLTVPLSLPAASARTPYDRLGDYVPWSAVGITVLAGAIAMIGAIGARQKVIRPRQRGGIPWERDKDGRPAPAPDDARHQAPARQPPGPGSDAAAGQGKKP